MTDLTLIQKIENALTGIPIDWMRNTDGTAAGFEIFYKPEATQEQKDAAQEIVADVIAHPENY